jgi:hypothetical protein
MPLPQPALPFQRMIVSYLSHCLFHWNAVGIG